MKKNILFVVMAFLCLSCMKEKPENLSIASCDYFYADFAEDYTLKSTVDITNGKTTFEVGDEVALVNSNSTSYGIYRYDGDKFVYNRGEKPTSFLYASIFFPASMVRSKGEGQIFHVELPSEQTSTPGTTLKNLPMMGRASENDGKITFYNLCTILKLSTKTGAASNGKTLKAATFTSHKASIYGAAIYAENKLQMEENGGKSISLTLPATPSVTDDYYLYLPAQSYVGGFELRLDFTDGTSYTNSASRDITLQPGYISAMEAFECRYFSGGTGSVGNPYRIATKADLVDLRNKMVDQNQTEQFRDKHYIQVADIDMDDTAIWTIGTETTGQNQPHQHLLGSYDGCGHKISNMPLRRGDGSKRCAFIGTLDGSNGGGILKNLKLENITLKRTGNGVAAPYAAALVARAINGAVIENCEVINATVNSDSTAVGIVAGELVGSTIRNCHASQCTVRGAGGNGFYGVGGLVGIMGTGSSILESSFNGGSVESVKNAAPSDGVAHHCGGILGHCTGGSYSTLVQNCTFKGTVSSQTGGAMGGIVGNANANLVVRGCTVQEGSVITSGSVNSGGIVGFIAAVTSGKAYGEIADCTFRGQISAPNVRVGGIVGRNGLVPLRNCLVENAVVNGTTSVGGAIGLYQENSEKFNAVQNVVVRNTRVTGTGAQVGGVIGSVWGGNAEVYDCKSINNTVTSTIADALDANGGHVDVFIGGIVGYVGREDRLGESEDGDVADAKILPENVNRIYRCVTEGGLVSAAPRKVGGVIGGIDGAAIVNECVATCDVSSTGTVAGGHLGGIVGGIMQYNENVLVINCTYYGGELVDSGTNHGAVGGIVGSFPYTYAPNPIKANYLINCFGNPEKVSSGQYATGGIAGYMSSNVMDNCFSPMTIDKTTSSKDASCRGSVVGTMRYGGRLVNCYGQFAAAGCNGSPGNPAAEEHTYKLTLLTDAQMKASAASVVLPTTGATRASLVDALNEGARLYNQGGDAVAHHGTLPYGIQAKSWAKGESYDYPTLVGSPLCDAKEDAYARTLSLPEYKMTLYLPAYKGKATPIVIVIPGGGYRYLASVNGHEGSEWAPYYNNRGWACAVLRYTLPGGDCTRPIADVENAIRYLRENASSLHVSAVGVHGFSAGGHLASTIATHSTGICKPDFQILFYPVITMERSKTHTGSVDNFLGMNPSAEMVKLYSNHLQVKADTPKAFVMYQDSETTVPPATNGAEYVTALKAAGVSHTAKVYTGTSHAWKNTTAQDDLTTWLNSLGY
ncbi:MAG: alpha/beta hydrolase [Bacteroidales bacterium]|nr:alpha/beta hydrolase [Bacteroidales bacterium]